MIKDIKLGLKMIKYYPKIKSQFFCIAIFSIIGIFFTLRNSDFKLLGGLYLVMTGIFFQQMIVYPTFTHLVASSPINKRLQTRVSSLFVFLGSTVGYIIYVVCRIIISYSSGSIAGTDSYANMVLEFILTGIMSIFVHTATAFSRKHYILSILYMLPAIILATINITDNKFIILGINTFIDTVILNTTACMPLCIAIGYILIISGTVLYYAFSCIIYKKEYDPLYAKAILVETK